ncbi:MAG: radical SAM protein [Campylobacteraceae bacterium]|jgi:wyosine [tRNA(Phe)-imidazoG37] synthetase (radical SAM superfamily)|nr:radical SAM protein [Campylobacteraceae bacterium]
MSNFIFGPVQSRRFGLSLGVDLSPDKKQCNFDCLYCELKGAKTTDVIQNPPLIREVVDELKSSLVKFPDIDVITITANGEPTLYPHLKELAGEINALKNKKKLLILSNAACIYDKKVQNALLEFDIVKLSLDAVTPKIFKKLNRPHNSVSLERMIEGLREFGEAFKNELVLEILVVKDFNDTRDEFIALNGIINEIAPSRVDISTIDRPSAYKVNAASYETLEILSREIKNIPVMIAKRGELAKTALSLNEDEIMQLLKMRPQSEEDVKNILDEESKKRLQSLLENRQIKLINAAGINFYKLDNRQKIE